MIGCLDLRGVAPDLVDCFPACIFDSSMAAEVNRPTSADLERNT